MGAELLQRGEHLLSPPILPRTSKALSQNFRVRLVFVFPPLFEASVDNPKATHAFEGSFLLTALIASETKQPLILGPLCRLPKHSSICAL